MKLIKYEAHNVLGVKDIEFNLDGAHLFLVGGANGQGKTSALTSLIMALCGKRGMDGYPPIALRKGQKKGKVTVELTGDDELMESDSITVELSLRRKASGTVVEEFRVLDSTGEEAPEPRTLLKRLFQLKAFDPLAFERMKPVDQARTVQGMLGVDLAAFDAERKSVYEERRNLGVEGKRLKAQLDATTKHKDVPDEEVSVTDLMSEMEEITASVDMRNKLELTASKYKSELAESDERGQKILEHIKILQSDYEELNSLAKNLEKSLAAAEESLAFDSAYRDRSQEMADLRDRVASADETNSMVRSNKEHSRLSSDVKRHRKHYQEMTDRIAAIDEEKAEAIAAAPWPVKGMELLEDGLLLDGLPFEQASTSQRIMASVKVGMSLNPKLRLLVCEHGSDLDCDTIDALDDILKKEDFQMLVELVTRSKEDEERCAVVISNGQVAGDMESAKDGSEDVEDDD